MELAALTNLAHGIPADIHGFVRKRHRQRLPRCLGCELRRFDGDRDDVFQLDNVGIDLEASARDARDVQQVVDEFHELPELAIQYAVGALEIGWFAARFEELRSS